jgi:hypothetical protein
VIKKPERSRNFDLKCACEPYKMLFSAEIEQDGSAITANWFESEYRQGGKIYGTSSEGLVEARMRPSRIAAPSIDAAGPRHDISRTGDPGPGSGASYERAAKNRYRRSAF